MSDPAAATAAATAPASRTPVLLVVLDGWGTAPPGPGNAVTTAATPTMDDLLARFPSTTLRTSGEAVGLPDGQMGNSEVGHLNLGAGFIVYQWITRIDKAIANGSLAANAALTGAIARARDGGSRLHLLGLVSDGGVHSHVRHLDALLELARAQGLTGDRVLVHALTDGRDSDPHGGVRYLGDLEGTMAELGTGRVASVGGRYFGMDRDHRWERVAPAYAAIVAGEGPRATSATAAVRASYDAGVTDEFIVPTVVVGDDGTPVGAYRPGDQIVWFNFRADRARQLTEALVAPDFPTFPRSVRVEPAAVTTLTRYESDLPVTVAFESQNVEFPVGRAVSDAGLAQFHAAETEKYAHVTYFFNGGREEPFPGEERRLVPSPKVATYDLQPEMSASGVAVAVVEALRSRRFGFLIVNFANGDMVGHTGVMSAAVRAIETVDACLGRILAALAEVGGVALVTADHGNAETMIDPRGGAALTAHTTNPVPLVLVAPDDHPSRHATLADGAVLSAVAPTVLQLLGVPVPEAMDQPSLVHAPSLGQSPGGLPSA